jgi:hypothetical protein
MPVTTPPLDPAAGPGRLLLLAGPAYTALLVAAAAAFPAAPGGALAAAVQPGWLVHHTGAVIAQAYVRGLAALAFVVLAVAVAEVCRRVLPSSCLATAALAGGVLSGGLMLLSQAVALGAAQLVHGGAGGDASRALGQLQEAVLDLSSLPATLLFAATGLAVLRTAGAPRWFGWLSLAGVPFGLLDAGSYDGGPLEAVGVLGLAYFLLWGLLAGVLLHRATGAHRDTMASTSAAELTV